MVIKIKACILILSVDLPPPGWPFLAGSPPSPGQSSISNPVPAACDFGVCNKNDPLSPPRPEMKLKLTIVLVYAFNIGI